jgi:hypothetical protein
MARLKLLGDTRIKDLLTEDGPQLASVATWTLQDMRKNFDLCEDLMKKRGEPEARENIRVALSGYRTDLDLARKRLQKSKVAGLQPIIVLSPTSSHGSDLFLSPESPNEKKSKSPFSRLQRSSPIGFLFKPYGIPYNN